MAANRIVSVTAIGEEVAVLTGGQGVSFKEIMLKHRLNSDKDPVIKEKAGQCKPEWTAPAAFESARRGRDGAD